MWCRTLQRFFRVETDLSEQLKFSRETEMLEPSGASLSGQ